MKRLDEGELGNSYCSYAQNEFGEAVEVGEFLLDSDIEVLKVNDEAFNRLGRYSENQR
ncbi:hypothetical protein [Archaeoglobus veneficus]|uniref:hypothetical protein n=1 Tax=Archaeoglobus veneficus TaxID=58290 RepID=UPI000A43138A|nr:hypothetical protein [Archaeoglobus veneficus]